MQTDPRTIKKRFKKSIDKYDDNAIVQDITADKMSEYLAGKEFDAVLEIGAGSGLLTSKLANRCSYQQYYANDLVDKSELYLKKYIRDVKFFAGDFRRIRFNKKFDLIAANAVFQWYENLDKIFFQCKTLLNPNGLLAFSTFSTDNFYEIKTITGLSLQYKSVDELSKILEENFNILKIENFEYKINFDNPLKILAHMKNTGVNSLSEKGWGIREVKDFCQRYAEKFPNLTLTYSPIIVIAEVKI